MEKNKNIDNPMEINEQEKSHKISIIIAVVLVLLAVSSIVFFFLFYSNNKLNNFKDETDIYDEQKTIKNVNEVTNTNVQQIITPIESNDVVEELRKTQVQESENNLNSAEASVDRISKGMILWQESENMGDLGYFKSPDSSCVGESEYYKVGNVVSEEYTGYDIYVVNGYVCQSMEEYFTFRMLLNDEGVIFFDGRNRFDQWSYDTLKEYIGDESENKIINGNIIIEDLIYPDAIEDNDMVIHNREYKDQFFYDESYNILKEAFNSEYGAVWMTDREKADKFYQNKEVKTDEDHDIYMLFNSNAFFIKALDGTTVQYTLRFDFLPDNEKDARMYKLPIVWSGGVNNDKIYELFPAGCGVVSHAYDMTQKINLTEDLKIIGTMDNGDKVYGYKSTQHPEFKKWYKDTYWGKGGDKKSEAEILKENPQIFWVDSFGRLLAFYAVDYISPAECGKPVIYLYPQEIMDVHVQVSPKQGFTITEPSYGENGWIVRATPNGEITNYADGYKYPYLFWEGYSDELYIPSQKGFVVTRDSIDELFDNTLGQLGLNKQEILDFKEFWVPKMQEENRPYYFVSFMSQKFINKSAPLDITPQPDTVIRVLMDYQGLDKYKQVEPQKLFMPERKGFTAVEWGGILH